MKKALSVGSSFQKVRIAAVAALLVLLAAGSALRAQTITMPYVTIGNASNAADSVTGSLYGRVTYGYNIGKYDVTDSQYCTFLNSVDPTGANALALYLPQGDAEYGITLNTGAANGSKYSLLNATYANMPVVDVDYWDTLRFANWMNNGQGSASTETGAYTLLGGDTDGLGTPSNAASLLSNPAHNAGANVWLPTENEWYKAAYYDPLLKGGAGAYYHYATQTGTASQSGTSTAPGNTIGSATNQANYLFVTGTANVFQGYSATRSIIYDPNQNYLTATGTFSMSSSYYGTFDQSGDVYNWLATTSGQNAVTRGGSWDSAYADLMSSARYTDDPTTANFLIGFRVASVPEPGSVALMLAAMAAFAIMRGKPPKRGSSRSGVT